MRIRQHVVPAKAGTHAPQTISRNCGVWIPGLAHARPGRQRHHSAVSAKWPHANTSSPSPPARGQAPAGTHRPQQYRETAEYGSRASLALARDDSSTIVLPPQRMSSSAEIDRQCVSIVMAGLAMAGTSPAMTIDPLVIDFDSINSLSVRPRPRVREDRPQRGSRAHRWQRLCFWIPACAGMSGVGEAERRPRSASSERCSRFDLCRQPREPSRSAQGSHARTRLAEQAVQAG